MIRRIKPAQQFYPYLKVVLYCVVARMSSEVNSDNKRRGVPLSEMYGSQSPWGAPEFPLVSPGHNHAVLYHVPSSGNLGDRPPKPQIGKDRWDYEHSNNETHLKRRWDIIEVALRQPIHTSQELASTILSYNTKFKSVWKFRALHHLFNNYLEEEESQYFFDVTLPEIAKLALALPKLILSPIPLLRQHKNQSVSLSQQQISSLLANAFFCTFPRRNTAKRTSEYANYPHINFNSTAPVGMTTFSRRSVAPRKCPSWPHSTVQLASLPLLVDPENTIEDADGLIQVDFANNKYSGYGHSFHWTDDFVDQTPFDSSLRRRVAVLAIDALPYSNVQHEYRRELITREITKAWIGFSYGTDPESISLNYPGVATGNWGCGAFGGSPQLKSLVQMMACAQAKRPMAYYTFKDNEIRDDVIGVYNLLARYNVTVGKYYGSPELFTSLTPLQNSPDLFSQGEMEECLKEVEVHQPNDSPEAAASKQTNKEPNNSRLFEEMQKLDEQSGRLNLSLPNTSPFKLSSNADCSIANSSIANCSIATTPMDTSNAPSDATTETKKKPRKITDYFSKKPL
ncbi:Poly(Adp-ribose) glycohydrolase [Operophtera brumata]|uniref:poly(ADP-ribose) glycohydrolase n=1 Tax=Operophtera brumata TaxID=104452 RepID=A0A0L7LK34_OPEBR|nr:Poly(Adp-ribose) glycohydrolase [Operophtera brumata]